MTEQSPVEALFFAALEKGTPAERAAYLDEVCGTDTDLRRRVERLLAAHPQVGSFLQAVTAPGAVTTPPHPGASDAIGSVIAGRYKLLEALGEGGMGTVYMAQQTEPVKRLVALKVIKPGMDSKQVLARFEAERQALALMDHPNIARVLDGGMTEQGRPYFVMELVKGVPITRFCDERKLTPRQRLELFVPVCQAIQHAHQKGVIHRDVKPSNVLVALYDGFPVPKVIDFGVAKAAGQQLTDLTLVTGFGTVLGTPEYMSPEQAELNQLDIDTRADVYALGVLLYELLTGTTPIDRKRLGKAAVLEILRVVREEEPPRPSTRLSTAEALASIAAARQVEPLQLMRLLRGELDWIVMKCLEKERQRRYESASDLAQDIQRYLHDESVTACPPDLLYQFGKLVRRNKGRLLTAAVVVVTILSGAVATTWQAAERRREQAARHWEQESAAARARQGVQLQLDRAAVALKEHALGEVDAAVNQAELLLADQAAPDLQVRLATLKKDVSTVRALDDAFAWRWNVAKGQIRLMPTKATELYPEILRQYGLAVGAEPVETTVQTVRGSAIAGHLQLALDQWFFLQPGQPGLRPVLDALDPDPLRAQIRTVVAANQPERVGSLLEKADPTSFSPGFITALGMYLPVDQSIRLLKAAWSRQPDSFPITITIAARSTELDLLAASGPEVVGWCRTAVALRPDSAFAHHCLGVALGETGDLEGRQAELREAMRLAPRFQRASALYIFSLLMHNAPVRKPTRQERDTAFAVCHSLLQVNPHHPIAHAGLFLIHHREENWLEAARYYRGFYETAMSQTREEQLQNSCPEAAFMLGLLAARWRLEEMLTGLIAQGRPDEAFRLCVHTVSDQDITDVHTSWRYVNRPHDALFEGACAGVSWSLDQSAAGPPAAEREAIRARARGWLEAVVAGWRSCFKAEAVARREEVHEHMTRWLNEAKLAPVRAENSLATLPTEERQSWQKLWADVRALHEATAPVKTAAAGN